MPYLWLGTYAVSQAIQTRLNLLKGEWWEDTSIGLPLFQSILGQVGTANNILLVDTVIKAQITSTIDVTGIENFSSTFDAATRKYSFSCIANTKYGTVTVTDTL